MAVLTGNIKGPKGDPGPQGPPGTGGGSGSDEIWIGAAEPGEDYQLWVDTSGMAAATVSIDQLFATTPFYVGHRGSGDVWPEHTMPSYQGAFDAGAKALEISAQRSSDGVWFCLHDAGASGLDRTTSGTGDPATKTIAQIQALTVDVTNVGPYWVAQNVRLPLLDDVLDTFYTKAVLFLETKDYTTPAVDAMLAKIIALPEATNYIIWKQHVNGTYGLAQARAAGFKTWAYIDYPLDGTQLTNALARGDYIGIPKYETTGLTDAEVTTVVNAAGTQKVITWPPPRKNVIDRLFTLGVDGAVTPQLPYILGARRTRDDFASGKVAPGDMRSAASLDYKINASSLLLDGTAGNPAVVMGSLTPAPDDYEITFEFRYDVLPTTTTLSSGLAFGKTDDQIYAFQAANGTGGYHGILRVNGQLQLYTHAAGSTTGTQIGSTITTAALNITDWATIRVKVTATTVEMQRMDGTPSTIISVANTAYRGKYFHLSRNHASAAGEAVRFRNVVVA